MKDLSSHSVGAYVSEVWAVWTGNDKRVCAVMDNESAAREVLDMISSDCKGYYRVIPFGTLLTIYPVVRDGE